MRDALEKGVSLVGKVVRLLFETVHQKQRPVVGLRLVAIFEAHSAFFETQKLGCPSITKKGALWRSWKEEELNHF
jgi:hypothetical protein